VSAAGEPVEAPGPALPEAMAAVLADYERHLVSERDLAPHTVRAYLGDLSAMLEHSARLGHVDVTTLDLRTLRSWLAQQQTLGKARTTMARRATAARVFTAWLLRTGRTETDPGAQLGSRRRAGPCHRRCAPTRREPCSRRPRRGPTTAAR
jgi:integrase/recombinase XerC